jgi:GNAT superfamily N-acetyltransferase
MASQADVRRIALSLPGTEEAPNHFAFSVRNKGKLKGFVWAWMERVAPRKARVPQPKVIAVRVANLEDKDVLLALDPAKFFTEPHYNGFPAVLVRLPAVTGRELRPIITEAWRCQASKDRVTPKRSGSTRAAVTFRDAEQDDAAEITALHAAIAGDLTKRFGPGHWSNTAVVRRVEGPSPHVRVRVGVQGGRIVSALRLQTRKPWAIDVACFTPVRRPLYLTGMVVAVAHQGKGLGRAALEDALRIARAWNADAIRLDAYDAAAGAGRFYEKAGFERRGRVVYKGDPLVYYELLLRPPR